MIITKADEKIAVAHPVICIYAPPGTGKTSLGYSAHDPILIDADAGAHRAINRRDTLRVENWNDIRELTDDESVLASYKAIAVDTVGRVLDHLVDDIARTDPKRAPGGTLDIKGWGLLKNRYRNWMTTLRMRGKDVLLIAHNKEDKDGDRRIDRPDIAGGSLSEVLKLADLIGYLYVDNKRRFLDFSPTEARIGKNPGQWQPLEIPDGVSARRFMADVFDRARAALGNLSEEYQETIRIIDSYLATIAATSTPADLTKLGLSITDLPVMAGKQVKPAFKARVDALGFVMSKQANGKGLVSAPAVPQTSQQPTAQEASRVNAELDAEAARVEEVV